MTIKANLQVSLSFDEAGALASGGPFVGNSISFQSLFADGVGAGQFDRGYMAERTVTTGANDDIDCSGSAIQTLLGVNIAGVELVGILIINAPKDPAAAPNTTNLTIGGSGSGVPGLTTAGFTIKPGGCYLVMSPDAAGLAAITNSTGDIVRVTNSAGASNKYQIALLMRSA